MNCKKEMELLILGRKKLPKKSSYYYVPEEIRLNGVDDAMEQEERKGIIVQNNVEYTKQQYEEMGITIIEEYDDLFWSVELPAGWEIKATHYSMWNTLVDSKGRTRANIYSCVLPNDRDSSICFK